MFEFITSLTLHEYGTLCFMIVLAYLFGVVYGSLRD